MKIIFTLLVCIIAIKLSFQNPPNLLTLNVLYSNSSSNSSNSSSHSSNSSSNASNSSSNSSWHSSNSSSNASNSSSNSSHSEPDQCLNANNLPNLINLVDSVKRLILRNATKMDAFVEEIAKANNPDFQRYVRILGSEYDYMNEQSKNLQDMIRAEDMIQNLEPFFCKHIYSELDAKEICLVKIIKNLDLLKGDLKFRNDFVEYLKKNEKNFGEFLYSDANGVEIDYDKILISKQLDLARFIDVFMKKMRTDDDYRCTNELQVPDLKELEKKIEEVITKDISILKQFVQYLDEVSNKDLDLRKYVSGSDQTVKVNVVELLNVRGAVEAIMPFLSKHIWNKLSDAEICLLETISDIHSLLTNYENSFRIIDSIDKFIRDNLSDYKKYLISNPENDVKFDIQKLMLDKPEFLYRYIKNDDLM